MTSTPEQLIATYRELTARRGAATSAKPRKKLEAEAKRLRDEWKAWQGEDSLHEMAFGEPVEAKR